MPFINQLPSGLENGEALIKRREKASERKALWRDLYEEAYRYAMPMRETFNWGDESPGQPKANLLYDSTLQESTYTAANTLVANMMPSWQRWMKLAPGAEIPEADIDKNIVEGLEQATDTFFDFLNQSNFSTVINETALDLMVGTAALRFDEGPDNDNPFMFSATPLSTIELEEGPNGSVETVFMLRHPLARNLTRMYDGMESFDLPATLQDKINEKPDEIIPVIQGTVFDPETKRYYGVVVWVEDKTIIWRFDYGPSSPDVVARASRIAGEIYGRGRVLLALSDARTLDKMQEFVLRHAANQVAPMMTGVTDGVLNPYTAVYRPNSILPVGSNATSNPSLRVMEVGGNFNVTDAIMNGLRERVRRTMIGPEPSEGPVKSATEINIGDRNRLWALGGEYGRIQMELLVKVVSRGIFILQRRGLIPKFRIDGRLVKAKFTSPFARSQDSEDLLAFERTMSLLAAYMPDSIGIGVNVDVVPEWISQKAGLAQKLMNDKATREALRKEAAKAALAAAQMQAQGEGDAGSGLA